MYCNYIAKHKNSGSLPFRLNVMENYPGVHYVYSYLGTTMNYEVKHYGCKAANL
jgi:hypothetical protein